ncbi:MAG: nicotinamide riboside transporter PnuC [Corynebacterium sp.]|nr:nicotinamide riboside transporter PnuC [Corynebacterium sp.]
MVLLRLLDATLYIGGIPILWREIIGNVFGLASAIGGMRRSLWAWPIGIIGNILLFTVFLGGVFNTPQNLDLYGQAGRQIMFLAVSTYGWVTWKKKKTARTPHWASGKERLFMLAVAIGGTIAFALIFKALGSWGPWADAWIFTGSWLATFGMARGWNEFWLVWVAVDIVGVPLLFMAGYYPSAVLYLVYAVFVIWGFIVWVRSSSRNPQHQAHSGT